MVRGLGVYYRYGVCEFWESLEGVGVEWLRVACVKGNGEFNFKVLTKY